MVVGVLGVITLSNFPTVCISEKTYVILLQNQREETLLLTPQYHPRYITRQYAVYLCIILSVMVNWVVSIVLSHSFLVYVVPVLELC